jgi:hypothetical protein
MIDGWFARTLIPGQLVGNAVTRGTLMFVLFAPFSLSLLLATTLTVFDRLNA